jgi:hypothetical protein
VLSFLNRTDFVDFAKKHSQVYESLLTLLAERLRETDTTIAAGTFCRYAAVSRAPYSNWRRNSARMSARAAL